MSLIPSPEWWTAHRRKGGAGGVQSGSSTPPQAVLTPTAETGIAATLASNAASVPISRRGRQPGQFRVRRVRISHVAEPRGRRGPEGRRNARRTHRSGRDARITSMSLHAIWVLARPPGVRCLARQMGWHGQLQLDARPAARTAATKSTPRDAMPATASPKGS